MLQMDQMCCDKKYLVSRCRHASVHAPLALRAAPQHSSQTALHWHVTKQDRARDVVVGRDQPRPFLLVCSIRNFIHPADTKQVVMADKARRMARLSARIFGEVVRQTTPQ